MTTCQLSTVDVTAQPLDQTELSGEPSTTTAASTPATTLSSTSSAPTSWLSFFEHPITAVEGTLGNFALIAIGVVLAIGAVFALTGRSAKDVIASAGSAVAKNPEVLS